VNVTYAIAAMFFLCLMPSHVLAVDKVSLVASDLLSSYETLSYSSPFKITFDGRTTFSLPRLEVAEQSLQGVRYNIALEGSYYSRN